MNSRSDLPVRLTFLAYTSRHWAVMLYTDTNPRLEWATGTIPDLDRYIEDSFPMYLQQYLVIQRKSDKAKFEALGFRVKVNNACYPMRKALAFAEMRDTGYLFMPKNCAPRRYRCGGKEVARCCDGPLCKQIIPSAAFRTPQSMLCRQCEDMNAAMKTATEEAPKPTWE